VDGKNLNGYDLVLLQRLLRENPDPEFRRLVTIDALKRRGCRPSRQVHENDKPTELQGFGIQTEEELDKAEKDLSIQVEKILKQEREGSHED